MTGLRTFRVDGMTCEGCARAVTSALRKTQPQAHIEVDLPGGLVRVGGIESEDAIRGAIEKAGFTFRGAADHA